MLSNATCNVTVTESNETELDIDIDIDNINTNVDCDKKNNDHLVFFEKVWNLYPKKEGKSRIIKSKAKLKELYKLGDELIRAVERYANKVKNTDKQYIKQGSTFFTTDYIDYLDKNYEDQKTEKVNKVKGFEIDSSITFEG